jgi:O-antigen ligase
MINSESGKLERIALYILFGYFLSTTFSHALAQIFLGLSLLLTIIIVIIQRSYKQPFKFTPFNLFIFLFLFWSIISALFGPTPWSSLAGLKEEWLFLMIPVVAFLMKDEKSIVTALRIFAISAIVISLYAVWQHFSGMDLYHGNQLIEAPMHGYRVRGFFTHRLTFGNYYATASILLFGLALYAEGRKNKIIFFGGFCLTGIATLFSYSRGSIGALIAGIVILLIWIGRRQYKVILPLIAAVIVIILMTAPDVLTRFSSGFKMEWEGKSGASRISVWRTAGKMIADHPIIGVGPENFGVQYINYRDKFSDRKYGHAHNDILNVAAYAGIPAAIFYLGFWAAIFVRMTRALKRRIGNNMLRGIILGTLMASVVFFLTSLFEASFADEETRLFLMAVWGLFLAAEKLIKGERKITEYIEKA